MKRISLLAILFVSLLSHAQDKFPGEWNLDVLDGAWVKEKDGGLLHCYERKSDRLISYSAVPFEKDHPFDSKFLFDINFLAYLKSPNILIGRYFIFAADEDRKFHAMIGVGKYDDAALYMFFHSNGYKNFPNRLEEYKHIPSDLKNKWNYRIRLLDKKTKEWSHIPSATDSRYQAGKIYSDKYNLVEKSDAPEGNRILERALKRRIACENERVSSLKPEAQIGEDAQKNAQRDVCAARDFISNFGGKWLYKNLEKEKTLVFDFLLKDSVAALGIPQRSLEFKDYFYNKALSEAITKYVGGNNSAFFHPFPMVFYDWVDNRIVLFRFSEFIVYLPEKDSFVFCASEEYFYCDIADIISSKTIIFRDVKTQDALKWEISDDFTEIRESRKDGEEWVLLSVMKKDVGGGKGKEEGKK